MTTSSIGITKRELDTPVLCLDRRRFEQNMSAMADATRRAGVRWRPHAKCHKSTTIARRLLEAGVIGLTCAKLGEAEVMADAGVEDLLIANMIVGPQKLERLVALRRRADPIVCIDHVDQARPLAEVMRRAQLRQRVLLEVDIGLNRVGVAPGEPALVLAREIKQMPSLELAGVMGYEGHTLAMPNATEKRDAIHAALTLLTQTRDLLAAEGIDCPIVSCGGTGSYPYAIKQPGITEVQAGGAIFMDAFYRHACNITGLQYALTVLTTIVSRPMDDRAIIDAGRKTLNTETHTPAILGRDDIRVESLSAEHGTLKLDLSARDLKIGDRLELIPGYADMTTVLHDAFHVFDDEQLVAVWPMEAHGRIQ